MSEDGDVNDDAVEISDGSEEHSIDSFATINAMLNESLK